MIYTKFLLPSAYGVLDPYCQGKEWYLTHWTLLRFLTIGGTLERVMILMLRWW